MTRRAPPLETTSRLAPTQQPVHRLSSWWAVLLALGLALTFAGCTVLPQYRFARALLTRDLANLDTALQHLGAMREIGASPLLAGNAVELLIDGPSTYRAMDESYARDLAASKRITAAEWRKRGLGERLKAVMGTVPVR